MTRQTSDKEIAAGIAQARRAVLVMSLSMAEAAVQIRKAYALTALRINKAARPR